MTETSPSPAAALTLGGAAASLVLPRADDLVAFRRDLHAHPELAWAEKRTTHLVAEHLEQHGLAVQLLPGTGLLAETGPVTAAPLLALRADLDALPLDDVTADPWSSRVAGVCHACGHDVHTTALLGAGLALHDLHREGRLPGRVRLIFQPAEEVMPGGAHDVLAAGGLAGVGRVFALHCDPSLDVGTVGLREGPITAASDSVHVRLTGRGGHTSRPHLTDDLTYALAKVVTDVPAALSRVIDPRAAVSMVWGVVRAGVARNVIPAFGELAGTVRMLDVSAWDGAEAVVTRLVHEVVAPYGVRAEVDYVRGVPPVVNEAVSAALLERAAATVLGEHGVRPAEQSMGGEDFAWFLEEVPGALLRLGTRTPGGRTYDLHQGDLRVDDSSVVIGAALLAQAAVEALRHGEI
ncbi:MAG TPA: amidohydrolase [Actinomycetales bacterium]|nr:amidohydrolase [Actinomycetales bacterium]